MQRRPTVDRRPTFKVCQKRATTRAREDKTPGILQRGGRTPALTDTRQGLMHSGKTSNFQYMHTSRLATLEKFASLHSFRCDCIRQMAPRASSNLIQSIIGHCKCMHAPLPPSQNPSCSKYSYTDYPLSENLVLYIRIQNADVDSSHV